MSTMTNWSGWDAEMQKALEADGEKLRQLTGDDHGPYFVDDGQQAIGALRKEASAAWDKCEERRLEAVALAETLIAVKEYLLLNDPKQLGPILRKIDAALSEKTIQTSDT